MRTVLNLSPLRKLCSKIEPVITLRSLALMTAPARASLMCSTVTMDRSWPSISNIVPGRKSLVLTTLFRQVLQSELVAVEPEPCDDAAGRACGHAFGSKLLARVDVGEVDLHHREGKRLQAIVEGERVVRERSRVDDHAGRTRRLRLQAVDDLPLAVALAKGHLHFQLRRTRSHHVVQVWQRPRAVDLRLPLAEKVQVGSVDDHDLSQASDLRTTRGTRRAGTSWPITAWPMRRGSTHATLPRRAFLSAGMAAIILSSATCGCSSRRPYAVSSSSCVSTSRSEQRPRSSAILAATLIPNATARPWEMRNRLAASSACAAVWP